MPGIWLRMSTARERKFMPQDRTCSLEMSLPVRSALAISTWSAMLVAVSEGAKMAAPGGATVPLHDGSECAASREKEWPLPGQPRAKRVKTGEACLAIRFELALNRMPAVAPERSGVLSGAGASGSLNLPWAHPRIVHANRTVPNVAGAGSGRRVGHVPARAC